MIEDTNNGKKAKSYSYTFKTVAIAVLIIIFLIPSFMVQGLIRDRSSRKDSATEEVSSKWGNAQALIGPILVIPYVEGLQVREAYFLPEELTIKGEANSEVRSRGIYDVPVYDVKGTVQGRFGTPNIQALNLSSSQMRWGEASVVMGVSDLRGIKEQVTLRWGNQDIPFQTGVSQSNLTSGVIARVPVAAIDPASPATQNYPFSFSVNLRGSKDLSFVPVGKSTNVELTSDWVSPSFDGAFLPESHTVDENGFKASWHILDLNRSFAAQWTDKNSVSLQGLSPKYSEESYGYDSTVEQSDAFGVRFFLPVDIYQKTTRSAKYAIAVIALVFVVVFFTEVTSRRRVHPVQYTLIGLALLIFYTLLLSLSEYIRFGYAYLIASIAIIGMVTTFVKSVMKSTQRGLTAGGILTIMYGFVYILLQMEEYTLLIGSIALFIILGAIMVASRRIDWYGDETQVQA